MLGADPAGLYVFEDAVAGVQAAFNAGMMCIGIGSTDVLKEARYVVKSDCMSLALINLKQSK